MGKIYITSPIVPSMDEFILLAKEVFVSKCLANMGSRHNELEVKLKTLLKVNNLSLFNNGTTALLCALKAFDFTIGSEIITTPWTFAATPHSIMWNGYVPVFCDIEKDTFCIDSSKIESLVTEKTRAILGVHVYGFPCDIVKIDKIAKKYNLKVVYDAAHAFTTEINGKGVGLYGDISMFSFHATKLFNTLEGGALTYNDGSLQKKVNNLRNLGICSEDSVEDVGINGKMNELQAIVGLLNLKLIDEEKRKRKILKEFYDDALSGIKGICIPKMPTNISHSYQYYPIVVEDEFPCSRDEIYNKLKNKNIFARKYFYPMCADYKCYKGLTSSRPENLPVANDIKNKILCLPFYGDLNKEMVNKIVDIIING
ncbi:MAG: DegT/DnrJ/EryC1/StrS family aminotransferase [Rickettsiales bacterium]|jgi:dTDP-4-amino-4,6-dideoxygalactose transaminase|nr:DegT/DnrJ/EryC1/StrS family aminotransferase [Rickettsiales bacterium]